MTSDMPGSAYPNKYYRERIQSPVFNKAELTGIEKVIEILNELEYVGVILK